MRIVLGSQSPRRREILSYFNLPFDVARPDFDEEAIPFAGDPAAHATQLALGKARSLVGDHPYQPILAADTVVFREGQIYGKPRDHDDARKMLSELSGQWHSVFTALAVIYQGEERAGCQETRVRFHELSEDQLERYLTEVPILDKAGAYAIQTAGGIVVREIQGCYYNVMGLPLQSLTELLLPLGIDLWNRLR